MIDSKITFRQLFEWYLNLETVKAQASFSRVKLALGNFCAVFGDQPVNSIKPIDIENYQLKREQQGRAAATIDMEVKIAQTAVTKAFDNDIIDGRFLKAFRKVKRKLKKGSNARTRTLSIAEYLKLISNAAPHLSSMIKLAYNTGMRSGEIRNLKWSYIDRDKNVIRMPADTIKESKAKVVPINRHVKEVLDSVPRAIHHDYVLTYKGRPLTQKNGYKRSFRTACKKSNIPCGRKTPDGIVFHDIRRTVKTNMLSAGIDKVHRDLILGHSLQGMDVHYIVADENSLRLAMEKYTRWLDKQIAESLASVDQTVDQQSEKG